MKWGVALNVREKLSETVRKAEVADQGGLEQVWVTDFPAMKYAPAVAAAIAEKTSSCRIGVGLVSPLLYSSMHIVQFMSTLIKTYGERFDLLLGPGDQGALSRVGVSHSVKGMTEDTIHALEEVKLGLSELGQRCSVFLGAQGPVMINSSLKADGVLLNYSDIEMVEWALEQIKKKTPEDFQLGVFPPTYVGDCNDIMSNTAISLSAAMVAVGLNKKASKQFGLYDKVKDARLQLMKKSGFDMEIAEILGSDVLRRFAFCGDAARLVGYLKILEEKGISFTVFGPPQGIRKEGVETLVRIRKNL
ncbi:MAG: LLM class flavin-dependent oxidoreductase [Candidatus Thorarchaeota archaeon]